ncbi:hypothetical protein HF888_12670 [Bermanella marisrubri]|uniref:Uncharacterized protein n=1 Tax=Bermanella marisrubri TaxID=207949 RepID=Q1MZW5_9GAMM|nr:hypothetical protein [Bermanella marisrubri]EAT11442.1 hypothetical protein RED65_04525 [Oceanobacter sp. RED65] [Bermanella marisrubri]QIZ85020.1 hypothetical protein HF888_12670 [Bermanella marisrubri]
MYALACVLLAISGVVLMAVTGVGPFSRDPWERYYFSLRKKPKWLTQVLLITASALSIACTLVLVGVIRD